MSTVYVFGAGASCAESAPSIANFMGKAFTLLNQSEDPEIKQTWKFLQDYFDKDPRSYDEAIRAYPQIDEIVTLIDYAINNNLSVSATHSSQRFYELRRGLINFISQTIAGSISSDAKPHKNFIEEIKKKRGTINIISLNYDTLLDEAIINSYPSGGIDKIDYGFEGGDRDESRKFKLLKLHGSLNWAHCPFCQNIRVVDKPIAHELYKEIDVPCNVCKGHYAEPVMITPTLLKSYNIPKLNNVWLAASDVISMARKIVFVGYSLASADYPIIDLMKRAISQKNQLKEIIIIGIKNDIDQVCERYYKIFGDRVQIKSDSTGFRGQSYW
ncbi:SIR2 family protein [Tumebacillus flagellatus]|uniref:Uncharacterized protein n=1 Tax=Tumebacillus flagellatus TaxID=1157490 RepID=A0A074M490_9BACL|nr:SIR2 family protein [Tumebacillus flagellatus]KEO80822.1 hypothetical protein EL26_24230 [Tumebacillus flagellatus]